MEAVVKDFVRHELIPRWTGARVLRQWYPPAGPEVALFGPEKKGVMIWDECTNGLSATNLAAIARYFFDKMGGADWSVLLVCWGADGAQGVPATVTLSAAECLDRWIETSDASLYANNTLIDSMDRVIGVGPSITQTGPHPVTNWKMEGRCRRDNPTRTGLDPRNDHCTDYDRTNNDTDRKACRPLDGGSCPRKTTHVNNFMIHV